MTNHRSRRAFLTVWLLWGLAIATGQGQAWKCRQVVIRANDAAVALARLENPRDQEFVAVLWKWVGEGKARVVSDVAKEGVGVRERMEAKIGRYVRWVSERDQDFDSLRMNPLWWSETFVGSSMTVFRDGSEDHGESGTSWIATFSPCDPRSVSWPVVWPLNPTPMVGAIEQPDFFDSKIVTRIPPVVAGMTVLAIVPPADVLEPDSPNWHKTDVFLAERSFIGDPASKAVGAQPAAPSGRILLMGFGLPEREAFALLSQRDSAQDGTLCQKLLARVTSGEPLLRTCCGMLLAADVRATLSSGREHKYPTEMPTIPSGWGSRLVGTDMTAEWSQSNEVQLAFLQHPMGQQWVEWACAVDAPELLMQQPRFSVQSLRTAFALGDGETGLVGVLRTPSSVPKRGVNGVAGETLLLFARQDHLAPPAPRKDGDEPVKNYEAEAVVFEVPAAEAKSWSAVVEGSPCHSWWEALQQRVQEGTAGIGAQVQLLLRDNEVAELNHGEDVPHIVGGEPDYLSVPGRYRPTAIERYLVGSAWTVQVSGAGDAKDATLLNVVSRWKYDTQPARHPSLPAMIEASQKSDDRTLPPLERAEVEWRSELRSIAPNVAHFLGVQRIKEKAGTERVQVGFLIVRARK